MQRILFVLASAALVSVSSTASAGARVLRVPDQHATIQAAVDAAADGDVITVRRGTFCGATIAKSLTLIGLGDPTIEGCASGPALPNGARVGFFLPGEQGRSAASGTQIHGFVFDGRGISNQNLEPLAFGIFGRFVNGARIVGNRFLGTVQAITNTAGDDWVIARNSIEGLTLFDCTALCTGGDGIVVQPARGDLAVPGGPGEPANRPESNWIAHNRVTGAVPDGFDVFSMTGILVFLSDGTVVVHNTVRIPDNHNAEAVGQGIVVTNTCCGLPAELLPGARSTVLAFNDVSRSEDGIIVEGGDGANTQGLSIRHNLGSVEIEGVLQPERRPRFRHRRPWSKHRWF
jgi:nitrous oxidase accessory protein NosD